MAKANSKAAREPAARAPKVADTRRYINKQLTAKDGRMLALRMAREIERAKMAENFLAHPSGRARGMTMRAFFLTDREITVVRAIREMDPERAELTLYIATTTAQRAKAEREAKRALQPAPAVMLAASNERPRRRTRPRGELRAVV